MRLLTLQQKKKNFKTIISNIYMKTKQPCLSSDNNIRRGKILALVHRTQTTSKMSICIFYTSAYPIETHRRDVMNIQAFIKGAENCKA